MKYLARADTRQVGRRQMPLSWQGTFIDIVAIRFVRCRWRRGPYALQSRERQIAPVIEVECQEALTRGLAKFRDRNAAVEV